MLNKKCPFCAEEIKDAAVRCKHCQADVRLGVCVSCGKRNRFEAKFCGWCGNDKLIKACPEIIINCGHWFRSLSLLMIPVVIASLIIIPLKGKPDPIVFILLPNLIFALPWAYFQETPKRRGLVVLITLLLVSLNTFWLIDLWWWKPPLVILCFGLFIILIVIKSARYCLHKHRAVETKVNVVREVAESKAIEERRQIVIRARLVMIKKLKLAAAALALLGALGWGGYEMWLKAEREVLAKAWAKPNMAIPAGEFLMGSPEGEGAPDAHPRHKVYLDAFYMDKTEVTNAAFEKFVNAVHHITEAEKGGGGWVGDGGRPVVSIKSSANWKDPLGNGRGISDKLSHPVVQVSWNDANAYCKWAGGRLPTEAEWEKAARGGTDTKYSFGNDESKLGKYDWYEENSNGQTHPVGQKKPNQYGLYDMYGNVIEWVSDWYADDYYKNSPSKNPKGPDSASSQNSSGIAPGHCQRGGSWIELGGMISAASRSGSYDMIRIYNKGFRCVVPAQNSK